MDDRCRSCQPAGICTVRVIRRLITAAALNAKSPILACPSRGSVVVVRIVILVEDIASVRGGGHDAAENRRVIAKAEPPRAVEAVVDPPDGDIGQIALAVTETE